MEITHDWLSGTGEARMDSAGNMLSYSGARTTYDVRVKRLAMPPDVKGVADRFERQRRQRWSRKVIKRPGYHPGTNR